MSDLQHIIPNIYVLCKKVMYSYDIAIGVDGYSLQYLNNKAFTFSLPGVATEDLFKKQRGTLGHILVEFRQVKLRRLDPGFSLLRLNFNERRLAAQPGKSQRGILDIYKTPQNMSTM